MQNSSNAFLLAIKMGRIPKAEKEKAMNSSSAPDGLFLNFDVFFV